VKTSTVDVLVVGAGPTGLALALQIHDHGGSVRILERRAEPFRLSRAMMMHPRTLELLRPLGITDALLMRGIPSASVHLHLRSRVVLVRSDRIDLPDTAFPHLLLIRQADVEAVLAHALELRGVRVERGSELVEIRPGEAPRAITRTGESTQEIPYRYLVGCDGADSLVRRHVAAWRGAGAKQEVILADLGVRGTRLEPEVAHVMPGRHGLLFLFPIGELAPWRMLATRPAAAAARSSSGESVPREQLQALFDDAGFPLTIREVGWSARIPLQHRLAARFRRGRIFIAGDAAHAHSPAAGQGMNMGIHDAINLGWKLAFAAKTAHPDPVLLDSYTLERRREDRRVLWFTRMIFWAEASTRPLPQFARGVLAPLAAPLIPWMTRRRILMVEVGRFLARFRAHYRRSPLSVNGGSFRWRSRRSPLRARPGSRVPDIPVVCDGEPVLLQSLLTEPGVHVLLEKHSADISSAMRGPYLSVHRLTNLPGTGVVIVRPDGYVGYRSNSVDHVEIERWLRLVGLGPPGPRQH
jgi:2-polyprenyl-6-methoxyphenol hydroxylase-like FAD-dependent oxidoreductase